MKKLLEYRLLFLPSFLTLLLLLGSQALACMVPSMQAMAEGRSMACCAEYCQMKTTPQAAQQACEQSRTAISQHQSIAGPSVSLVKIALKDLPNAGLCAIHELPVSRLIPGLFSTKEYSLAPPYRTVELYLFTRSLLI